MLTVSVNGQVHQSADDVIIYSSGVPVAMALKEAGDSIIWLDAARDPIEFAMRCKTLGILHQPINTIKIGK